MINSLSIAIALLNCSSASSYSNECNRRSPFSKKGCASFLPVAVKFISPSFDFDCLLPEEQLIKRKKKTSIHNLEDIACITTVFLHTKFKLYQALRKKYSYAP